MESDSPTRMARLAGQILTAVTALLILVMLGTWAPHYLTWPWWPDLDTYATIAQGWDQGVRPYRDVVIFNFPGQIYLFWLLGHLFGWGHTAPLYAVDVALLLLLGAALVAWSRRRLGGALPGLIGFAAIVDYYLRLDMALVAQRDWHGALLAVVGVLLVQTFRGPAALGLSALAFAAGAVIRPHIVLFLPVLALAIDESVRPPGGPRWRTARAVAGWGLLFAALLGLMFLPLIATGLLGDLIRGVRVARYGGTYSHRTLWEAAFLFAEKARDRSLLLSVAALVALIHRAGPAIRRLVVPWLIALGLALIYAPLHPVSHGYLYHPLQLIGAINLALLAGLVQEKLRDHGALLAFAMAALLVFAVNRNPTYCSPRASLRAFGLLARREMPTEPPPGAAPRYGPTPETDYEWGDYRDLLSYLREKTGPETRVANALKNAPYPAINGPAGRVSPWPTEGGMPYLRLVDIAKEESFARALEGPQDSVVVWVPDEAVRGDPKRPFRTPLLDRTIRALYRPEAKFGAFEVWRRRGAAEVAPGPAPSPG